VKKKNPYKKSSWNGKPYNFFGDYLWEKYKCRVLKLPIDAGFTCPNRDGTLGTEGCIFCGEDGSASPTALSGKNISVQMETARNSFRRSDEKTKYIAYFQAFTNTYAHPAKLKELYDSALIDESVTGLMIGTRPDFISDDIINLIASYIKPGFELWLEIGMQSSHDKSLDFLNRGHNFNTVAETVKKCHEKNIPVLLHVILGIPGETWDDMMKTAERISALPVNGVKIHHLHVITGTKLEKYLDNGKIKLLTLNEYTSIICDFIERLRPDILIHRLIGDRNEKTLAGPKWAAHKGTVLKSIEDEFSRRMTYQGFLYEDSSCNERRC
jgi:radical SAM protein (TIGR01212 family)